MVVMVVAEQDVRDGRQILKAYSRSGKAAHTGPRNGADSLTPDRIGENVPARVLNEKRGVVDERYAAGGGSDGRRRNHRGWWGRRAPRRRSRGQFPAENRGETERLGSARVEETTTVAVVR